VAKSCYIICYTEVRTCTALFPQCVLCSKLCSIDYVANYVANNVAILGNDYVANDYVANCVARLCSKYFGCFSSNISKSRGQRLLHNLLHRGEDVHGTISAVCIM
jgi:hypothetical protein